MKMKRGLIRPRGKGWEGVISSYKATKNKNRFAIKRAMSPWVFFTGHFRVRFYLSRSCFCGEKLRTWTVRCFERNALRRTPVLFPFPWKRDACYAFALTIYFYVKAIERRNTGPVILAAFLGSLAARRDSRVIKRSLGGKEWIRAAQEVAGRKSTGEAPVVQKT